MRFWKYLLLQWIVLLAGCCFATMAFAHSIDLNRQQVTTFEALIADLQQAQVVFVGEMHDQRAHHRAQLQVIQALHAAGVRLSIGLEMFRRDGQPELDRWLRGESDEAEFAAIFNQHWSFWPAYRKIFLFARAEQIPLLGLNIERELVNQVAQHGFASLSAEQRKDLPMAACNVSPRYREFIRRALHSHAEQQEDFEHFCEAQILWDASMAQGLAEYLQQHPQRLVVVLAGNGHSWKHGIPEQLQRRGPYTTRVLLPEVPGRIDLQSITAADADYLLQGVEWGALH